MSDTAAVPSAPAVSPAPVSAPASSGADTSGASAPSAPSESTQTVQSTGPSTQPPTQPPKTYKLKVNGQVMEAPADVVEAYAKALGVEPEYAIREGQLLAGGYKAFGEAKKLRDEAESFKKRLKEDPAAVLKELGGIDPDEWAIKRALERYEQEKLAQENPAELARQQLEAERAQLKKRQEAMDAEDNKRKRDLEMGSLRERWNKELPSVLERANIGQGYEAVRPLFTRRIADELEKQHRRGMSLDPDLAAVSARDNLHAEVSYVLSTLKGPQQIIQMLGPGTYKALLRYSVEQAKTAQAQQSGTPAAPAAASKPATVGILSPDEWRKKYGA